MEIVWEKAFDGCSALTSFDFGTVEKVYANSFRGCTSIQSATLTNLSYIVSNAFSGWTEEQSIFIPTFKWSALSEAFKENWTETCKAVTTWASESDD